MLRSLAVLLTLTFLFAACGSDDGEETETTEAAEEDAPTTEAAEEAEPEEPVATVDTESALTGLTVVDPLAKDASATILTEFRA